MSCFFRLDVLSMFDHFLGSFWESKSMKFDVKIYDKIHVILNRSFCDPRPLPGSLGTSRCRCHCVFQCFSASSFSWFLTLQHPKSSQRHPKRNPKGRLKDIENASENVSKKIINVESDLGLILTPKKRPKWRHFGHRVDLGPRRVPEVALRSLWGNFGIYS